MPTLELHLIITLTSWIIPWVCTGMGLKNYIEQFKSYMYDTVNKFCVFFLSVCHFFYVDPFLFFFTAMKGWGEAFSFMVMLKMERTVFQFHIYLKSF